MCPQHVIHMYHVLVHYINLDSIAKDFPDRLYLTQPNIEGFWIQTFDKDLGLVPPHTTYNSWFHRRHLTCTLHHTGTYIHVGEGCGALVVDVR